MRRVGFGSSYDWMLFSHSPKALGVHRRNEGTEDENKPSDCDSTGIPVLDENDESTSF